MFRKFSGLILGLLTMGFSLTTYYLIIEDNTALSSNIRVVIGFLSLDLVLFLLLTVFIAHQLIQIRDRRKSVLQVRIVWMFAAVGIVPTVLVSLFSTLFFNYGIQSWFNGRVETALEESVLVAQAYLDEHRNNITADAMAMAYDLSSQARELSYIPRFLEETVQAQSDFRGLVEAVVFQEHRILARSRMNFALNFASIPNSQIRKANEGQIVLITDKDEGKVRALLKLKNFHNTYLLVGRLIDNRVLYHMETTRGAATSYHDFRSNISTLQVQFYIIFILVSLLLLLASIWAGTRFADKLVKPIINLASATEKVTKGDLKVRVEPSCTRDEVAGLELAFNQMTSQLDSQHNQLISAHGHINERRIFIETIISNLSSGVIVLDQNKEIALINYHAQNIFSLKLEDVIGKELAHVIPAVNSVVLESEKGLMHCKEYMKHAIDVKCEDRVINLSIRVAMLKMGVNVSSYIITFDDITKLVAAQKASTWADIARRIAHEIKNPITPIGLAAERLRKMCIAKADMDDELALRYIDTIIRHSNNLRIIVDEFANFARMPNPVFMDFDIVKLVNEVIFSSKIYNNSIEHQCSFLTGKSIIITGDEGQLGLALENLIKNACQSIVDFKCSEGQLTVSIIELQEQVIVVILDNGEGFRLDLLEEVFEPYVTTREYGTGLGLAIVKKIIDEHNGTIELGNNKGCGAYVKITLPKYIATLQ